MRCRSHMITHYVLSSTHKISLHVPNRFNTTTPRRFLCLSYNSATLRIIGFCRFCQIGMNLVGLPVTPWVKNQWYHWEVWCLFRCAFLTSLSWAHDCMTLAQRLLDRCKNCGGSSLCRTKSAVLNHSRFKTPGSRAAKVQEKKGKGYVHGHGQPAHFQKLRTSPWLTSLVYFCISIVISRRDMNGFMGFTPKFLNYKNRALQSGHQNRQKNSFSGLLLAPLLKGQHPSPNQGGARPLFSGVLAGHDRGLSPRRLFGQRQAMQKIVSLQC